MLFSWKDDHSVLREESELQHNRVTSHVGRIQLEDQELLLGLCELRKKGMKGIHPVNGDYLFNWIDLFCIL